MIRRLTIFALFGITFLLAPVHADDWPQWLGPTRDSRWRETGVIDRFPEKGLTVKWRVPVELGYAGPAVADGKVYVMDYARRSGKVTNDPGNRDRLEGEERVLCLEADTGKLLWKHTYERPYQISFAGGPRCTPIVDGDRVYALGAEGNLWCLSADDGRVIWSKDFAKEYHAQTPVWGVAAHPLVDDNLVYCLVGGADSVAVAFDKMTGREVWHALSSRNQGYCPPTMIQHAGKKQLLIWHSESLNSLDPQTGSVYWSQPLAPSYGMSIAAPRQLGDYLFASGYGNAAVLLKLEQTPSQVDVVWRGKLKTAIYSATCTPFLEKDMIYGCDSNTGTLMGVRLQDGERLWQTREPTTGGTRRARYGTAFLVKHEDHFFLFSETGDLILANLSPDGYDEISRFHVLDPTNTVMGRPVVWSHPAFAQRCLFARNDKELVCVSLAKAN